jgi:uncharacterized glyoxalase superfamily protein PhnB
MSDLYRGKGMSSALSYQDPKAAVRWLEKVLGFESLFVILDADDNLVHGEMTYGDSLVMIGTEWTDDHRSPISINGKNSQSVHVQLARGDDIDAHCAHARAAGATILAEPETQFYGERSYRLKDLEGHIWSISVTVQEMTPEQWDKASGLTTRKRLD